MKFFLDTANIDEIKQAIDWGVLDGVTTNPSLIAGENRDFEELVSEICSLVDGPVSLETTTLTAGEMVREAEELIRFGPNVVVKVGISPEGVKAVRKLSQVGIKTNVTLTFSSNPAILAAKAGATYVSPFIGRLDDVGHVGMNVIKEILTIFRNYAFTTQLIVASIRHPLHVVQAAKLGAPIATMPFKVMEQLFKHPLTDIGLERFLKDWEKVKRKISLRVPK